MLTRLKLKRGEGKLVGISPQGSSRRENLSQSPPPVLPGVSPKPSPVMAHQGELDNMTKDEKNFKK